jgi:hypothetical protein
MTLQILEWMQYRILVAGDLVLGLSVITFNHTYVFYIYGQLPVAWHRLA